MANLSSLNALIKCIIDCPSMCNWPINVPCPQCLPQCMLFEIAFDLIKWKIEGLLSRSMYLLCQINVFESFESFRCMVMIRTDSSMGISGDQTQKRRVDGCIWDKTWINQPSVLIYQHLLTPHTLDTPLHDTILLNNQNRWYLSAYT